VGTKSDRGLGRYRRARQEGGGGSANAKTYGENHIFIDQHMELHGNSCVELVKEVCRGRRGEARRLRPHLSAGAYARQIW
jgi:hypothetical protein